VAGCREGKKAVSGWQGRSLRGESNGHGGISHALGYPAHLPTFSNSSPLPIGLPTNRWAQRQLRPPLALPRLPMGEVARLEGRAKG